MLHTQYFSETRGLILQNSYFFINIVNNNSFQQLSKLKRSYEKLQRKHLKEAREGALSREEDRAEMSLLNSKMEVQRLANIKWTSLFISESFNSFSSII